MGNEFKGQAAHSAEHFGDTRDHWWNLDFLRLMAKRWRLDAVRDVLDVGCGIGHWGMLLASVMPEHARVTGIDREPSWVERAGARVVAEPNNLSESLLLDSISNQASIDEIVALVPFQLTCERGKVALGEGDNSLGDRVPGLFVAEGLAEVEVHVNDKATAVFPPYAASAQRAFTEDARDRVARRLWNWSEADARRFFVAGGGSEADFAAHFARGLANREAIVRGLDDGTYHGIIGGAFYLVAGRKPATRL